MAINSSTIQESQSVLLLSRAAPLCTFAEAEHCIGQSKRHDCKLGNPVEIDMASSEPRSRRFFLIAHPSEPDEHKAYMLDIPMERLELFKKMDPEEYFLYIPHNHAYGEPWRFPKLSRTFCLGSYASKVLTVPAIIDTTLYCFLTPWVFMSLNLDNPVQWERAPQPIVPDRWLPKIISLRSKIYIFGSIVTCGTYEMDDEVHFGQVYNPQTKQWSPLKAPHDYPFRSVEIANSLFVASLGESTGKIMFSCPHVNSPAMVYIYDTDTDTWDKFSSSIFDSVPAFNRHMCIPDFINEDDNNLYWVDKKYSLVFAFDWKHNQLYNGPIVGLEDRNSLYHCAAERDEVSFHHLSADLFCMIWWSVDRTQPAKATDLHVTVLRVIKHPSICSLDAMVVGCFHDTIDGYYPIFNALPV